MFAVGIAAHLARFDPFSRPIAKDKTFAFWLLENEAGDAVEPFRNVVRKKTLRLFVIRLGVFAILAHSSIESIAARTCNGKLPRSNA